MIKYTEIARMLERELNGELSGGEYENITAYGLTLGVFGENDRYQFRVVAGDMDYEQAQRIDATPRVGPTNTSTYYINGVFRPLSDGEVQGINSNTLNTVMSAELGIIIPHCDREAIIENQTVRLQDAVLALIGDKLSIPKNDYYTAEDGTVYYLSFSFGRINVGEKQIRGSAGMSLTATLYMSISVVATGISSLDLKLLFEGDEVYTTRLGIARTSVQEGAVSSTSGGVSQSLTTATSLTISFDAPLRRSAFFSRYKDYTLNGNNEPFEVKLVFPADEAGGEATTKPYTVSFGDVGVNGELNLAASVSVRLVEALDITTTGGAN